MTTLRVFPSSKILDDKSLHNLINAKVRHCRIGKVTVKKPEPIIEPLQGWQWTQQAGDVWWVLPQYPNFAAAITAGCITRNNLAQLGNKVA